MIGIDTNELFTVSGGVTYCDGLGLRLGNFFLCLGTATEGQ